MEDIKNIPVIFTEVGAEEESIILIFTIMESWWILSHVIGSKKAKDDTSVSKLLPSERKLMNEILDGIGEKIETGFALAKVADKDMTVRFTAMETQWLLFAVNKLKAMCDDEQSPVDPAIRGIFLDLLNDIEQKTKAGLNKQRKYN